MIRRALTIVLVNAIVFVVFAELVGLFFYYDDTGHLFYLHRIDRNTPVLPRFRYTRWRSAVDGNRCNTLVRKLS